MKTARTPCAACRQLIRPSAAFVRRLGMGAASWACFKTTLRELGVITASADVPRSKVEAVATMVAFAAVMTAAYFLDHARVFAFGVLPAIYIEMASHGVGVRWSSTPRLWLASKAFATGCVLASVAWVIAHPVL